MLFCIDCDGVLRHYCPQEEENPFDRGAVEGIHLLGKIGYRIAIASGKSVPHLVSITRKSGLQPTDFYFIGENGAIVVGQNNERLYTAPQDGYQELRKILEQHTTEIRNGYRQWNGEVVGYVTEETKEAILTLLLRSNRSQSFLTSVQDAIQNAISREGLPLQVWGNHAPYWGSAYIDILPAGVNKATAVKVLLKHLGIPIEQTGAIGDSGNDDPMLRLVRHPSAVGNATNDIKSLVIQKGGHVAQATFGAGVLEIAEQEKRLFS